MIRVRDDADTDAAPSAAVAAEPETEPAGLSLDSRSAGLFVFPPVFEEYFCYNAILAGMKRRDRLESTPLLLPLLFNRVKQRLP